jgi:hypothetical protein
VTRRQLGPGTPRFDVAAAVDLLRDIIARTDALVHATEYQLERLTWHDDVDEDGDDDRRLEHLSHLLGAAKEAARAAVTAGDEIAAELAKHRGCS